jgi:hypothetical protein
MSQRASGYERRPNEDYGTPSWLAETIAPYLRSERVVAVWEPMAGDGLLAQALKGAGFSTLGTAADFFRFVQPPVHAIVSNPAYGQQGALACQFIVNALSLDVRVVCTLLRVDFDSAKTRVHLFRDCPRFAGKIVLLDRIKWFDGPSGPSDNHAWFVWNRGHRGDPWTRYAERPG